jgi:uncharacterized protein involved in outer membrane biogenesis
LRLAVAPELLSSLLSGHLRMTKVVLQGPTIHLETAGHGVGHWQIAETAPARGKLPPDSEPQRRKGAH